MQLWLYPVSIITSITLVILFFCSFDSLEFQEIGLNYSWVSETVEPTPYEGGRYYLGLGNHFLKFPKMVMTILFVDDLTGRAQGPALKSRTKDGLNVNLEVSFQYKLRVADLSKLFFTMGPKYEPTFVRMAIEQLTTAATGHNAHFFFSNRTAIADEMHDMLNTHFQAHAYADVPFFQLRTVHLPAEFEDALQDTQVKQQAIQIAKLSQNKNRVTYETSVLKAEQAVKVLTNQANAEAAAIMAQNGAYCQQYQVAQSLQSEALAVLMKAAQWTSEQLLDYMRIRAVREHPAHKTTIRL